MIGLLHEPQREPVPNCPTKAQGDSERKPDRHPGCEYVPPCKWWRLCGYRDSAAPIGAVAQSKAMCITRRISGDEFSEKLACFKNKRLIAI